MCVCVCVCFHPYIEICANHAFMHSLAANAGPLQYEQLKEQSGSALFFCLKPGCNS